MKYAKVPLDELQVDPEYQRELDEKRVKKMTRDYDPRLIGTLEVSRRNGDGVLRVFDGQHRLESLRRIGETSAPCLVHTGLTQREEALLFVELQDKRKPVHTIQRFKARVVAQDPLAMDTKDTMDRHGFKMDFTAGKDSIASAQVCEQGQITGSLDGTLALIREVWDDEVEARGRVMIGALMDLVRWYSHDLNDERKEKLRRISAVDILRQAKSIELSTGKTQREGALIALRRALKLRGPGSKKWSKKRRDADALRRAGQVLTV